MGQQKKPNVSRQSLNRLGERKSLPYEDLLSENNILCDVFLKEGNISLQGYMVEISSNNLFVLSKKGNITLKTIIPLSNVIFIRQYYIDFNKLKDKEQQLEEVIEKQATVMIEDKKEEIGYLPGERGRKIAKMQFKKALKLKDSDFIKPEDMQVSEEDEAIEQEKKISGEQLLKGELEQV